jgi:hypothetical protein
MNTAGNGSSGNFWLALDVTNNTDVTVDLNVADGSFGGMISYVNTSGALYLGTYKAMWLNGFYADATQGVQVPSLCVGASWMAPQNGWVNSTAGYCVSDTAALTPLTVLPNAATSTYGSTTSTQNKFYNTTILTSGTSDTGGGYKKIKAEATGTPSGSTTFFDIAVDVPTGCKLLGCQLRVDTALTAGETWSAAYVTGSSTVLAAAGQAVTKNTKVDKMHVDEITSATTKVRITRDSGSFTNAVGVIRAVVYYETLVALSNNP